VTNNKKYNF